MVICKTFISCALCENIWFDGESIWWCKQLIVCPQENERTKDLIIEQKFHRTIIGQKGEKIKEVRDKFPEVLQTRPVCHEPSSDWTGFL